VGGNLSIGAGFNNGFLNMKGTSLIVTGNLTLSPGAGARIGFGSIFVGGNLTWEDGTLQSASLKLGTNKVTLQPPPVISVKWSGGTALDSSLWFGANTDVQIINGPDKEFVNSSLTTYGTVTVASNVGFSGPGPRAPVPTWNNYGTISLQATLVDNQVFPGGQFEFNNYGLLKKNDNNTYYISFTFNNAGQVQVTNGALRFRSGGLHTGVFSVSTGASILFYGFRRGGQSVRACQEIAFTLDSPAA
jgi:hypothetical protein